MDTFADKLKSILIDKNITPYRLSKLSGIGQSSLSDILSGKNNPSGKTLQKICAALDISMAEFDENKKEAAEALPLVLEELKHMDLNDEEKEAYEIIKSMSASEQQESFSAVFSKYKKLSSKNKEVVTTIIDALASSEK
ncbi:MAG: Cro/C1-type DNA-binding domain [Firmicutes bacterium]|nr:Cro/C1-type DNA-binding domain [Bacillota bacterium]